MQLTELQFLTGLFSLIIVVLSAYVGIYIASRYFKTKINRFLFVGISWIGLANGWWPSAVSFLMVWIFGTPLPLIPYLLLGNLTIPWFLLIWIMAVNDFLNVEKKKIIMIIFIIFAVLYNGLLLYYIAIDPSLVGQLQGPVDVQYSGLISLFLIIVLVTVGITGILFARESFKSDEKQNKIRGTFIALAFISWTFGAIFDSALTLNFITLPIVRILLISASIEFYIGIIMPESIKKRIK